MLNDFITLQRDQTAATEVSELLQWLKDLRSVYERGIRIRDKMKHNFNDSGGANTIDWAPVQTKWGIPVLGGNSTGPTANGAIVFTFMDGTVLSLQGSTQSNAGQTVTERVG